MRVATDVGGTFTDLVCYDETTERTTTIKCDTTPPRFEQGVMDAIRDAGVDPADFRFFVHGTTVVINALTERRGARTGLITTRGFRDVLEIARGNRPDLFNFYFSKPAPFVPRHLRREVGERTTHKGEIVTPFDPQDLEPVLAHFRAEQVEAVAICFLHAYANPANEIAAAQAVRVAWPEVSVVSSHEITREWREYERCSTAVLSAYVHPLANRYLDSLERRLIGDGFAGHAFIMQSNGGVATIAAARENPIALVESGPVSGILGAIALARLIDEPNLIALDIGGTTAKCALIENGQAKVTTEYKIGWSRTNPGYPIKTPVVEIVEIGNGGGSIAWLDAGGKLHVGPQSAGAVPGPAAYGRGGSEPTTTDANLVVGRINPENFVGGQVVPDMAAVRQAFGRIAEQIGAGIDETARGVIRIANANMVNALKLVSVNKGRDPRDFALIAFGGGGGMHAAALARELGIPKVIVPVNAAVFSAWGMLMTDLRRDYIRTRVERLDRVAPEEIGALHAEILAEAERSFAAEGFGPERLAFRRQADMRYVGQEHSVKIDFPASPVGAAEIAQAVAAFHDAHEREYGFRLEVAVEIVNHHLVAFGIVEKAKLAPLDSNGRTAADALCNRRRVDFDDAGIHDTMIYDRTMLAPGAEIPGPAVIEEPATTIVVFPDQSARIDEYGNVTVAVAGSYRHQ